MCKLSLLLSRRACSYSDRLINHFPCFPDLPAAKVMKTEVSSAAAPPVYMSVLPCPKCGCSPLNNILSAKPENAVRRWVVWLLGWPIVHPSQEVGGLVVRVAHSSSFAHFLFY